MVLVDTTVCIDLLRGTDKPIVAMLRQLLGEGRTLTTPVVVQGILQGASSPASLQRLRAHFLTLPMIERRPGGATHAAAGELYASCRWQGVTPRSPHDCLIAQMAIDHDVELLQDDRDFQALAAVDRRLRLVPATGS